MKLSLSLSQKPPLASVYSANQVLENEASIAQHQGIVMYDLMQSAGAAVFAQLLKSWPSTQHILVPLVMNNAFTNQIKTNHYVVQYALPLSQPN